MLSRLRILIDARMEPPAPEMVHGFVPSIV